MHVELPFRETLKKQWMLLPILAGALFLRLGRLDLMQFQFDDGVSCIFALQTVVKGSFKLVGLKSSLNIYNPPFFIWIISIPTLFSRNPVIIASFIALLGTGGVVLTYIIGCRFFEHRAGIIAAILYALSPCAIYYSRRIFAQDVMPLMSGIVLFALLKYIITYKPRALFIAVAAALVSPGIHFSGLIICASLLVSLLIVRPTLKGRPLLLAIGCATVMYIPYCIHLIQSGFIDLRLIFQTILTGDERSSFSMGKMLWYVFNIQNDTKMDLLLGANYNDVMRMLPGYRIIGLLLSLMIPTVILWSAHDWFILRQNRNTQSSTRDNENHSWNIQLIIPLIVWIIVPVLIYSVMKFSILVSYLAPVLPASFLLAGLGIARLTHYKNRSREKQELIRGITVGLLVGWCIFQIGFIYIFFTLLTHPGKYDYPYIPYRDQVALMRQIHKMTEEETVRIRQNFWDETTGVEYNYYYLSYYLAGEENFMFAERRKNPTPRFDFMILDRPEYTTSEFIRQILAYPEITLRTFGSIRLLDLSALSHSKGRANGEY